MKNGLECGVSLEKIKDFEIGDILECVRVEYKSKPLDIGRFKSDSRNLFAVETRKSNG